MNSYNFHFIRHLMSCNNIDEGKIEFGGKDFDPSGTIYGITETIVLSKNSKEFSSKEVYVSNLIRTWITAFLLYGTNNNNILKLFVSPYLKEKHETLKRGNYPKEIAHTVKKFELFLQKLKTYAESNEPMFEYLSIDWYNSLPKSLHIILPDETDKLTQTIIYTKDENNLYQIKNFCNVKDTVGPISNNEQYLETGDLIKFMNWFTQNVVIKNTSLVHVVTHSQVMRSYLLSKFNYDLNKESKINQKAAEVRHSNSWRFVTNLQTDLLPTLVSGVPLKKEEAKNIEKYIKNQGNIQIPQKGKLALGSLCGQQGSIDTKATPICLQQTKVGGKSRKKTKKDKKHKSKTKNNNKRVKNKKTYKNK